MSIRARLLLLCLTILLPILGSAAWGLWILHEQQRTTASVNLVEITRTMSALVFREFERKEATLRTLALAPSLQAGDLVSFYGYAKAVAARPNAGIVFAGSDGVPRMNTRVPLGTKLATLRLFKTTSASPAPQELLLSDVYLAPLGKRYSYALRIPVMRDQQIMGYLGMGSSVETLQRLLDQQQLRPDWNITILDSKGTIVARRLSPERFLGVPAGEAIRNELRIRREGSLETIRRDGVAAFTAFTPIGPTDWTLVMSVPKAAVHEQFGQALHLTLTVAFAILAISLFCATYAAAGIARPIRALVTLARSLGKGEIVEVPPEGLSETRIVAQELKQASEQIRSASRWMNQKESGAHTNAAEQASLQTERLEMFGKLVDGIAHDFNNALQTAVSAVELGARTAQSDSVKAAMLSAKKALSRGATLTRQLGTFALGPGTENAVIDLGRDVDQIVQLLKGALREKWEIDIDFAKDLWPIDADPARFELALLNIALNARDGMPAGGHLDVRAVNVRIKGEEGQGIRPDDYVQLSIHESTRGITSQELSRASEIIFTAERSETTLAHVYMLAEQSGGRAEIQNEAGRGTRTILLLPRAFHRAPGQMAVANTRNGQLTQRRCVLFVDDDPLVCQSVIPGLEAVGLSIKSAHDPSTALEILSQSAIDVVLSDIMLPGEGGIALAEEIKRRYPDMPVVLATGYTADSTRWPHTILRKPYTLEEAIEALQDALDSGKLLP